MTNAFTLRSVDIPQLSRFGIGFDRVFDQFDEILRTNSQQNSNYPPYNIVQHNVDKYTIQLAIAGFKQGEINIEVKDRILTIEGKQQEVLSQDQEIVYLHHGISSRDFSRVFHLVEYVEVINAKQENGILTIELERKIPPEKKPKQIAITYVV